MQTDPKSEETDDLYRKAEATIKELVTPEDFRRFQLYIQQRRQEEKERNNADKP